MPGVCVCFGSVFVFLNGNGDCLVFVFLTSLLFVSSHKHDQYSELMCK